MANAFRQDAMTSVVVAASVNDDAGMCASADCTTITYQWQNMRVPENEWIACGCF